MSQTAPRTETPLFYDMPIPLDREKHRDLRIRNGAANYGFSRDSHFIPALIDEFSAASREMPILFVPSAGGPTAVFMVGVETGRNALVADDGSWKAGYVPAYLRRYPFILGEADGQDPILCIDAKNEILISDGEGEALFGEGGEPTGALQTAIDFSNEYFAAGKRTERFIEKLAQLDLFFPITVEQREAGGASHTIHGLLAINEAKLHELGDKEFLSLRDERLLAPIFAHLFSLTQIEKLRTS